MPPDIWRDPDEQPKKTKKSALKADPTAAARSSIRRRASVHGSRNRRLTRDPTFVPPRFERSPPRTASTALRYSRRNGVPPIQSLLEHADRSLPLPPPPPPVPHSRHYYTLERRERELRDSLDQLHAQAANLRRSAQDFIRGSSEEHDNALWTEAERRTLLETASVAQSRRPGLQRHRSRSTRPTATHESLETESGRDAARHLPRPSLLDSAESEPSDSMLPRTLLPTPPLDQSEPDGDSLFMPDTGSIPATTRPLHPLAHAWRVSSPTLDGLGDRDRSPTPTDTWAIMETTIPEDTTFVSVESSFATAPATSSFASSNDTTITEPERRAVSGRRSTGQRGDEDDNDDDSDSSVDIDCTDEEYIAQAESFAREMYYHEMATPEGRARIFSNIPDADHLITPVDVGFQLIDSALNTEEGRERVANLGGDDAIHRMVRFRDPAHRTRTRTSSPPYRPHSPPATSQEPPSANPVSPPSRRSAREVSDILIDLEDGNDQQDLETMRRVARRLATREDVPDDWWASMGLRLNPSLAQPRQHHRRRPRSPDGVRRADMHAERALGRVRGGRIDRGDARL